ncbi:hypothetical protein ACIBM8_28920 [Micromonospora aurantiaca]|uniref:hypothetical protein n=1 Tax=Micromonospora aurantiaca (nom. illeg.) TaxID=47850 RepID=UPI0037B57468
MTGHLRHPRDLRQSACGLPATDMQRWETDNPPRFDGTREDCYTLLPEAARPDDANHPTGDATQCTAPAAPPMSLLTTAPVRSAVQRY